MSYGYSKPFIKKISIPSYFVSGHLLNIPPSLYLYDGDSIREEKNWRGRIKSWD